MIGPRARVAIAVAFFAYVLLLRTYDISNSFLMLGDQIRDWTIALGPLRELPLTGPPSVAGGTTLGPIYYWVLWIGRHLVGPFTDNLPHAGGITIALLQSIGDVWLLVALWRRVPVALALAMSLFVASAPFDLSISAVIWNPPVAAAFAKMAMAMLLMLDAQAGRGRIAATALLGWLAVQAHSPGVFVGAPVIAALVALPLLERNWRRAIDTAGIIAAVIALLQAPYVIALFTHSGSSLAPTVAIQSVIASGPTQLARSFPAVVNATAGLLIDGAGQWSFQLPAAALGLAMLVLWRKDLKVLAVSVAPVLTAVGLFASWPGAYDSYWFLTITSAMVLTIGLLIAKTPNPRVVEWTGIALLAAVLAWQPHRLQQSKRFFTYPQYRAMAEGSRRLAAQAPVLRDIRVTFAVHPAMDKYFIYGILGGRIDPGAPQRGFIEADGSVRVE